VLWWADTTTGARQDVTVEHRLGEICARYGPGDVVTRFIGRARQQLLAAGQSPVGSIQVPLVIERPADAPGQTLLPEFSLLKGDLLLPSPHAGRAAGESWFQRVFDKAKALDARMLQLRVVVRLCRLWRDQGKPKEADRPPRALYESFTEGLATADDVGLPAVVGAAAGPDV
jgi:hypothetical protein